MRSFFSTTQSWACLSPPIFSASLCVLFKRRIFLGILREQNVIVADKMVGFFLCLLRRFALAEFLVCKHGLADVDAAVVEKVCPQHLAAVCLKDVRDRHANRIVAQMAYVQWLVGVRTAVFDQDR